MARRGTCAGAEGCGCDRRCDRRGRERAGERGVRGRGRRRLRTAGERGWTSAHAATGGGHATRTRCRPSCADVLLEDAAADAGAGDGVDVDAEVAGEAADGGGGEGLAGFGGDAGEAPPILPTTVPASSRRSARWRRRGVCRRRRSVAGVGVRGRSGGVSALDGAWIACAALVRRRRSRGRLPTLQDLALLAVERGDGAGSRGWGLRRGPCRSPSRRGCRAR